MLAECQVTVADGVLESFPQRPDRARQVIAEAEESLAALAAERHRSLCSTPELVDVRDTGLGFSELTFRVDTRAD